MSKSLFYICSTNLLDHSLEQIKYLKVNTELYVILVVFLSSPNSTIFSLKTDSNLTSGLFNYNEIKNRFSNINIYDSYFNGCKNVKILVFNSNYSFDIFINNYKLFNFFKNINPYAILFDDISPRLFLSAFFCKPTKLFLNIHDPKLHLGEFKLSTYFIRILLFNKVNNFFTFSEYSKKQFLNSYNTKSTVYNLSLLPYYSYKMLNNKDNFILSKGDSDIVFLFFGRISLYKGIDILVETFNNLTQFYPNIKLIIAGKGDIPSYILNIISNNNQIYLINRHISSDEIINLFNLADALICPYLEATQSGVIMTAAAFNKFVIASNVGSFSEYIGKFLNGIYYDIDNNHELNLKLTLINFIKLHINNSLYIVSSDKCFKAIDDRTDYNRNTILNLLD